MQLFKICRSLFLLTAGLFVPVLAFAQPQITGLDRWSLFIDPGHSQRENMGVHNYSEAEKVLEIGLYAKYLLETMTDIDTVYISRSNHNQQVSLTQRTDFSNRVGASFFHSIHSNAGAATTNNVLMLWGQIGNLTEKVPNGGKKMSDIMIRHLRDGMRLPSIGSRGDCSFYGCDTGRISSYLHVNRVSSMASTLSEAGFHTNPTQNMKNMNAEWKKLEAWIHFITYLEYNGVDRPYMGIVNGVISNKENNAKINGATATINGKTYTTDTFESLFHKYTNDPTLLANGFYYFDDVADGTHELTIEAPGYYSQTLQVTVVDTFFTFQDVELISSMLPTVVSTTPVADLDNHRYLNPVVVQFNRPMNKASVEAAFSISPAVDGVFTWSQQDTRMTFNPGQFIPETTYEVTIAATASDNYEHEFDGNGDGEAGDAFTFTFKTGPEDIQAPVVQAFFPANNQFVDHLRPAISVTFDEVVNPEDLVEENFKLSLFNNASYVVPGTMKSYNVGNQTVVNYFPAHDLQINSVWRFVVASGIRDMTGNASAGNRTLRFRTSADDFSTRTIDNFDSGIGKWWLPSQSGSTSGTVADSVAASSDNSHKLAFSETGASYKLKYGWDVEAAEPLMRIHMPSGSNRVRFSQESLVQMYVFGDGSGTKIRFAVDDRDAGAARLEVSPWQTIDWIGWKLVTWDVKEDGIGSWIGNNVLTGDLEIESIQLTRGDAGTEFGTLWFDDLRIATRIISTDLNEDIVDVPETFRLEQNYPNPFNPSTTIAFHLESSATVSLTIYNVMGQKVSEVITNNFFSAGRHEIRFDAAHLASGTYLYRLNANGKEASRKMVLIK